MHSLQQHILLTLARGDARFAVLRPAGVESNQLSYHLSALQSKGLVIARGGLWQLTTEGQAQVARMSVAEARMREQPVLYSLLLVRSGSRVVALPRARHPFLGTLSLPFGKVHMGETIAEAAAREWEEKVSAPAPALSYAGTLNVRFIDEYGESFLHALFLVHTATLSRKAAAQLPVHVWHDATSYRKRGGVPLLVAALRIRANKRHAELELQS